MNIPEIEVTPEAVKRVARLTTAQLAERAGVRVKTVSNVLNPRTPRPPHYYSVERVAIALNKRLAELKREEIPLLKFHAWVVQAHMKNRAACARA